MAIIKGQELLKTAIQKFALNMDKVIDDAVRITAINVENEAIKSLNTHSTGGNQYPRGNKIHTASKEGESPNSDTGNLAISITTVHQRGAQIAYVGTDLEYGAILETEKNRPWLEPAKESQVKNFEQAVKLAVIKQIESAG